MQCEASPGITPRPLLAVVVRCVRAVVVAADERIADEVDGDVRGQRALDADVHGLLDDLTDDRPPGVPDAAGRRDDIDRQAGGRVDGRVLRAVVAHHRGARGVLLPRDGERVGTASGGGVVEVAAGRLAGGESDGVGAQGRYAARGYVEDLADVIGIHGIHERLLVAGCAPRPRPRLPRRC